MEAITKVGDFVAPIGKLVDGVSDLFSGNKAKAAAKMEEIEQNKNAHEAYVARREDANKHYFQEMRDREEKLQQWEKEEKEFASMTQKELLEIQNEQRKSHDARVDERSRDNKDRLEKTAEMNANILTAETLREKEDKTKLADRNAAEKIRSENRQKEVEAEHGEKMKQAEILRSTLQDAKIAEAQKNSERVDKEKSEHIERVLALKNEQHEAALVGSKNEVIFKLRDQQIDALYARGQAKLADAFNEDLKDRRNINLINSIMVEKDNMVDSASRIVSKLTMAQKRNNTVTKITMINLNKAIQQFNASTLTIRTEITSTAFQYMDQNDAERRVAGSEALNTLKSITEIVSGWRELSEEGAEPEAVIEGMLGTKDEFNTLVQQLSEQLQSIPLPVPNASNFSDVIANTKHAITTGVNIGIEQLGITEGPSNSEDVDEI